jgi:uncharacterized protein YprB with RNaseH-like and TPR domain
MDQLLSPGAHVFQPHYVLFPVIRSSTRILTPRQRVNRLPFTVLNIMNTITTSTLNLDTATFLRLAESANKIAFFDSEVVGGLKADYGHLLVFSVKPINGKVTTFTCAAPGDDRKLAKDARNELEKYSLLVSCYGRGFDVPFLNTRLLRHHLRPLEKRHHLDLYFLLRYQTLTSRRSQGHFCSFLGTDQQKLGIPPQTWGEFMVNPERNLKLMTKRCETDVIGLQQLFQRTRHLISNITT